MRAFIFRCALGFLALFHSAVACLAQAPVSEAQLDPVVADLMKEWQVPGLVLGIVQNGRVVLAKGYGVRAQGQPGRVDAQTIFSIASITKSMTGVLAAKAQEEGKVDWNSPIRTYWPTFSLANPDDAARLTMADLLSEGFSAEITPVPFQGYGVVVLSNRYGNPVPQILTRYVVDLLAGQPPAPWNQGYRQLVTEQRAIASKAKGLPSLPASMPVAALEGRFQHVIYGALPLKLPQRDFANISGGRTYVMTHLQSEAFELEDSRYPKGREGTVRFLESKKGIWDALEWELDDAGPMIFSRVSPRVHPGVKGR